MSMIYTNKNLNGNDLIQVGRVELTGDASVSTDAAPLSQVQSVAATAVQAAIVEALAQASDSTMYSSEFVQSLLDTKQPNLTVDNQYFTLIGNHLGFKDLGIVKPHKDMHSTTLAEFIAGATFNGDGTITTHGEVLDKMSIIFLQSATDPSEKAFVYMGTNAGTADDFVSFSVDYNQGTIRSFFSGTGVGINYTSATGAFSLSLGTTASKLGAQTLPVDSGEFNVITGSNVLDILKATEEYITLVDTNATGGANTAKVRLDNLSGTTGNTLNTFSQGLFSDSKSIKEILQESEVLHKNSLQDRTAIYNAMATETARVDAAILAEKTRAESAESVLQSNISAEANARQSGDAVQAQNLTSEVNTRTSETTALGGRLDVIEGVGVGSVAKAESDAKAHADSLVNAEEVRATTAEAAILQRLDNELVGDSRYIGFIQADGTITVPQELIDAGETRDGADFKDAMQKYGNRFDVVADVTITFDDSSTLELKAGNVVTAQQTVAAGSAKASDFAKVTGSLNNITKGNLMGSTIELKSGNVAIVDDSIGRDQLGVDIEADIDDKVSLTQANAVTSDGNTHTVIKADMPTGVNGYQVDHKIIKYTGTGIAAGTQRGSLTEMEVHATAGQAVDETVTFYYKGDCDAYDHVTVVKNFEYKVTNPLAKAIGVALRGHADAQGSASIVSGITGFGEGSVLQNQGASFGSQASGVGSDIGVYAFLTDLDEASHAAWVALNPVTEDASVVVDNRRTPSAKAIKTLQGVVDFKDSTVEVASASSDVSPVNLGDVKAKQAILRFDLSSGSKPVQTGLDLSKVPPVADGQIKHGSTGVTISASETGNVGELQFTATGSGVSGLTEVLVYLQEFSCDITDK